MLNPHVPDAGTRYPPFHVTERPLNPEAKKNYRLFYLVSEHKFHRILSTRIRVQYGTAVRLTHVKNNRWNVQAQHVKVSYHLPLLRKQASHVATMCYSASYCKLQWCTYEEVTPCSPVGQLTPDYTLLRPTSQCSLKCR
jgi:hypothetical protein